MRLITGTIILLLSGLPIGCASSQPPPPDEAVLEGEWHAVNQNDGSAFLLRFNSSGILVSASLTDGSDLTASIIGSTSEVDGDSVVIRVPHPEESSVFTGTLSADRNTISGDLVLDTETTGVSFGNVIITIPRGPFVLNRI